jgi:thioredoxin 1
MAENVLNVSDQDFRQQVLEAQEPVLVDFWAAWCGPCRMMAPVISEVAEELKGKVKVAKVDVDASPTSASQYGVMSIPTLVLFNKGQEVHRSVGFVPKERLVRDLATWIS